MSDVLNNQHDKIIKLLSTKAVMKQDVFQNTMSVFEMLRSLVAEVSEDLRKETERIDKRVTVLVNDVNPYALQLKVAGDILEFYMHSNVFEFDKSHPMFKMGYIKQNEYNSYCGIINIYNFLADSFKYNRLSDLGYLIARIFINREGRFFVEAKAPLAVKYNSFSVKPLEKDQLKEILNELIIHAISFDLFTPPFETVHEVSVMEIQEKMNSVNLRTAKRLGYSTNARYDDDVI